MESARPPSVYIYLNISFKIVFLQLKCRGPEIRRAARLLTGAMCCVGGGDKFEAALQKVGNRALAVGIMRGQRASWMRSALVARAALETSFGKAAARTAAALGAGDPLRGTRRDSDRCCCWVVQEIERQLKKSKGDNRKEFKLLLLGTGESGKSTILKQMRIIYGEGFDQARRQSYTAMVYRNLLRAMRAIAHAIESQSLDLDSGLASTVVRAIDRRVAPGCILRVGALHKASGPWPPCSSGAHRKLPFESLTFVSRVPFRAPLQFGAWPRCGAGKVDSRHG